MPFYRCYLTVTAYTWRRNPFGTMVTVTRTHLQDVSQGAVMADTFCFIQSEILGSFHPYDSESVETRCNAFTVPSLRTTRCWHINFRVGTKWNSSLGYGVTNSICRRNRVCLCEAFLQLSLVMCTILTEFCLPVEKVRTIKVCLDTLLFSYTFWCFLGAFAKLRRETISFVLSVCLSVVPSVCPHGTTWLPLDGFHET